MPTGLDLQHGWVPIDTVTTMQGGYDSMDISSDDGSESDYSSGEVTPAQAILGFEDGRYHVHWEGESEGEATWEMATFALAGCADLVHQFWQTHREQCAGCIQGHGQAGRPRSQDSFRQVHGDS